MALVHVNTAEEFKKEVTGSDKPVIVDFWAAWCMPCKMLGPVFEKLSEEMTDVKFVKVDVEEANDVASAHNITSIPTLIFVKGGKIVGQTMGALSKQQLKDFIEKNKGE